MFATLFQGYKDSVPLILIVEDNPFIALDLEYLLKGAGYLVAGPATSLASALAILQHIDPDAAILDVTLQGAEVTPVARALAARGVPFVLASGDLNPPPDEVFAGVENLGKPTDALALVRTLDRLISGDE